MPDALWLARRLRQCALKSLKLAENSRSREVARHYQIISRHYTELARLAESGEYVANLPLPRTVPSLEGVECRPRSRAGSVL
jgi:hypothetical protein